MGSWRAPISFMDVRERTDETIDETLSLIQKIKPLSAIFYVLTLYPGTRLYREFKEKCSLSDDIWLEPVEDILYFQTDPGLSAHQVLDFGKRLRAAYYQMVSGFALNIKLIDDPELFPSHAGFLSRAAMTFSHGEYGNNPFISHADETALELYRTALTYHPHPKGLSGIGHALSTPTTGPKIHGFFGKRACPFYPKDPSMNLCMGINYMNLQQYQEALHHLSLCEQNPDAWKHMAVCYRELGRPDKAEIYEKMGKRSQGSHLKCNIVRLCARRLASAAPCKHLQPLCFQPKDHLNPVNAYKNDHKSRKKIIKG